MSTSPVAAPTTGSKSVVLQSDDINRKISPLSVGSWALYDFANTIFSLNIISVYFPAFIIRDLQLNDWVYAYPMSASLLVVALISPLLGAMSDRGGGRRMPWLIGTTLLCVTMTAVMGLVSNLWLVVAALILA